MAFYSKRQHFDYALVGKATEQLSLWYFFWYPAETHALWGLWV